MKKDIRTLVREFLEQELEEVSTSGAAGAYDSPNAFTGMKRKGEEKRKKTALMAVGYTLTGDSDTDEGDGGGLGENTTHPLIRLIALIKEGSEETGASKEAREQGLIDKKFGRWAHPSNPTKVVARNAPDGSKLEWLPNSDGASDATPKKDTSSAAPQTPKSAPKSSPVPNKPTPSPKPAPKKDTEDDEWKKRDAEYDPYAPRYKTPTGSSGKPKLYKGDGETPSKKKRLPKASWEPQPNQHSSKKKVNQPDQQTRQDRKTPAPSSNPTANKPAAPVIDYVPPKKKPPNPFLTSDIDPKNLSKALDVRGYKMRNDFNQEQFDNYVKNALPGVKAEDVVKIPAIATSEQEQALIMKAGAQWLSSGWSMEIHRDEDEDYEPTTGTDGKHYPGGTGYQAVPKGKPMPQVGMRLFFTKTR